MKAEEPTTRAAIDEWIAAHQRDGDPFVKVAEATAAHRADHGCDAFEGGDGPLLGTLTRAVRPNRVLEVGTALGYGALWLAHGAGMHVPIQTIERDPTHAALAREQFALYGHDNHIEVSVDNDIDVLAQLDAGQYDVIVYDAGVPTPRHLELFDRLLSRTGVLLSSNLFLGQYIPDLPGLEEGARYREALFSTPWRTGFAGSKAITVRSGD